MLDEGARAVLPDREPLGAKNQRLDIKVQAPTVEDSVATVVIEIKWSDNKKEISTSLVKQLGEQYLVGLNLTHGIYLVGWCGPREPDHGKGLGLRARSRPRVPPPST